MTETSPPPPPPTLKEDEKGKAPAAAATPAPATTVPLPPRVQSSSPRRGWVQQRRPFFPSSQQQQQRRKPAAAQPQTQAQVQPPPMTPALRSKVEDAKRIAEISPAAEAAQSAGLQQKLETMKEMFPRTAVGDLFVALSDADGDVSTAASVLTGASDAPQRRPQPWADAVKRRLHRQQPQQPPTTTAVPMHQQRQPQKPQPPAAAAAAAATSTTDAEELLASLGKTLDDQLQQVQRRAQMLLSIQTELKAITAAESEAVGALRKDREQLVATKTALEAQLADVSKRIADADARIKAAEATKATKLQALLSMCRQSGLSAVLPQQQQPPPNSSSSSTK